jgi:hypothetical protein
MSRGSGGPAPPSRALPDLIVVAMTGSGHPLGTRSIRRRVNRMLAELHDGVGSPWEVSSAAVSETLDRERGRRFLRIDEYTWRLVEEEVAEMASAGPPWDDPPSAQVILEALAQTPMGRRVILRDAFPMLVEAARGIEPLVAQTLQTVARQVDEHVAARRGEAARLLARAHDGIIGAGGATHRTVGRSCDGGVPAPAEGHLSPVLDAPAPSPNGANGHARTASPPLGHPAERQLPARVIASPPSAGPPPARRSQQLPPLVPDPTPGAARSRFDATARVVLYNDRHPDYLLVKDDEPGLLDYLTTLAAKEYVVDNHPRASGDEVAEEMVRVLVCLRHHLTSRR